MIRTAVALAAAVMLGAIVGATVMAAVGQAHSPGAKRRAVREAQTQAARDHAVAQVPHRVRLVARLTHFRLFAVDLRVGRDRREARYCSAAGHDDSGERWVSAREVPVGAPC